MIVGTSIRLCLFVSTSSGARRLLRRVLGVDRVPGRRPSHAKGILVIVARLVKRATARLHEPALLLEHVSRERDETPSATRAVLVRLQSGGVLRRPRVDAIRRRGGRPQILRQGRGRSLGGDATLRVSPFRERLREPRVRALDIPKQSLHLVFPDPERRRERLSLLARVGERTQRRRRPVPNARDRLEQSRHAGAGR